MGQAPLNSTPRGCGERWAVLRCILLLGVDAFPQWNCNYACACQLACALNASLDLSRPSLQLSVCLLYFMLFLHSSLHA
jgi:hypothetical protein